jgi:hypothetical protein
MKTYQPKQRTNQQNRALHLGCRFLSDQLNTLGLEMKLVLKPDYQIWWTPSAIKEHLIRPLMKAKYGKTSTTELAKLEEIDNIWEDLMRILGERFGEVGFEYIPFPDKGFDYAEEARKMANKLEYPSE